MVIGGDFSELSQRTFTQFSYIIHLFYLFLHLVTSSLGYQAFSMFSKWNPMAMLWPLPLSRKDRKGENDLDIINETVNKQQQQVNNEGESVSNAPSMVDGTGSMIAEIDSFHFHDMTSDATMLVRIVLLSELFNVDHGESILDVEFKEDNDGNDVGNGKWQVVPKECIKSLTSSNKVCKVVKMKTNDQQRWLFRVVLNDGKVYLCSPSRIFIPSPNSLISSFIPLRSLITNNGKEFNNLNLNGKHIFMYFSADWCAACKKFTPQLASVYQKFKSDTKYSNQFDIVFVSSDKSEKEYKKYISKMPWLSVKYEESGARDALSGMMDVSGIPALRIISRDGMVIDHGKRSAPTEEEFQGYLSSPKRN